MIVKSILRGLVKSSPCAAIRRSTSPFSSSGKIIKVASSTPFSLRKLDIAKGIPVRHIQFAIWKTDVKELLGAEPFDCHLLSLKHLKTPAIVGRFAELQ